MTFVDYIRPGVEQNTNVWIAESSVYVEYDNTKGKVYAHLNLNSNSNLKEKPFYQLSLMNWGSSRFVVNCHDDIL